MNKKKGRCFWRRMFLVHRGGIRRAPGREFGRRAMPGGREESDLRGGLRWHAPATRK